jgi:hypothetical protein
MSATYSSHPIKRLTLYIPERDRFDNPIRNIGYWTTEAVMLLNSISGAGSTHLIGKGSWIVTETGQLQQEPVNILYTDVEPAAFNSKRQDVLDFMERFGTTTGQDAVAAEYDGEMHFIRIKHEPLAKEL